MKKIFSFLSLFSLLLAAGLIYSGPSNAQIAQRGTATTAVCTGSTTLTIDKPAGVVAGDLMIVTISYHTFNTTPPVSDGWTLIQNSRFTLDDNVSAGTSLYRIAGGSEGENYLFTFPDAINAIGGIIAFSGVDYSLPFDIIGDVTINTDAITVTATSITTSTDNSAILMLAMAGNDGTFTSWNTASPGVLNEILDAHTTYHNIGAAWAIKSTFGTTGNGTATISSSSRNMGILLSLREGLPAITGFTPDHTCYGTGLVVTITGTNFLGTSSVKFNGTDATFDIDSPTQITATVPINASTGPISITNNAGTSESASDFVANPVAPVTGPSASAISGGQSTISWTNPVLCTNEIMIVGKAGSPVTATPEGDGSQYTANVAFGSGTGFDGGYVLYKGTVSPQVITALTSGPTYYFTLFNRNGTVWSDAVTITASSSPVSGDYRTVENGDENYDWNNPTNWEVYDETLGWIATTRPPNNVDNLITIRSGHKIVIAAPTTVDQVVAENGSTVETTYRFVIADGNGDDFTVYGTFDYYGGTLTTTGTLVFGSGAVYSHLYNGGIIPDATWHLNSTCKISGFITYNLTGFNPTGGFGNLIWEPLFQNFPIKIYDMTVKGDFTISNTGSNSLALSDLAGNYSITIGGDLNISGSSTFRMNTVSNISTLNVGGDINITGTNPKFYLNSFNGTGSAIVNIFGDLNMSSGSLMLSKDGGGINAQAVINLAGDLNHTGGTISNYLADPAYAGTINFTGTEVQTYNTTGIPSGYYIHHNVNEGVYLQMAVPETVVSGAGSFTLSDGATLGITSPDGITETGGLTGNIQVTGTRTYSPDATYIYNGNSAQVTGNGLPPTIRNLKFDNTGGTVTFSEEKTIGHNFSIETGSKANLVNGWTHLAGTLTLGGVDQPGGSYGHPSSTADNKNDTYFDSSTGIVTNAVNTWRGTTSDEWNLPANWSLEVPSAGLSAIIPSAAPYQPVISGSEQVACGYLTINQGASLTIAPSGRATITTLKNNGTLNLQSTSSSDIFSLILDEYSPESTGTNNIQLYLTGGGNDDSDWAWHYISSPVTSLPVTTFTGATLDVARYDEVLAATDPFSFQRGWVAYDGWSYLTADYSLGFSGFSNLQQGKGYNYWAPDAENFTVTGTINTSNPTVSLTYTGSHASSGYNLLGNPYTSGLDLQAMFDDGSWPSNVLKSFWFTSNSQTFVYANGVGVPGSTESYIPPMQGFFVKTSGSASLGFPLSARAHTSAPRYKGSKASIPLVRLSILSADGKSEETVVRFDEKAKSETDMDFDAPRMFPTSDNPSIYTLLDGIEYTINGLPFPEKSVEIPLAVSLLNDGNHTINAIEITELDKYDIILKDELTQTSVNLRTVESYSFTGSPGTIDDRFILSVSLNTTGTEDIGLTENAFNVYHGFGLINIQPLADEWDGKTGSIRLTDLSGKALSFQQNAEFRKDNLIQLPAPETGGLYFIEIRSGVLKFTGKVVVK